MELAEWQAWWKHFGSVELRHLLLLWWDPIGVYGFHEARDEYDRYSGRIARMLREGADAMAVASVLADAEEKMGMSHAPERDAAEESATRSSSSGAARWSDSLGGRSAEVVAYSLVCPDPVGSRHFDDEPAREAFIKNSFSELALEPSR